MNPSNPTNPNSEVRHEVHLAMLAKSDSAKNLGELTVVPLGFAVTVAMELVDAKCQRLLDAFEGIIGEDEIENPLGGSKPEGLDKTYDIKCYHIVARNHYRRQLRTPLTALREEKKHGIRTTRQHSAS